MKMKLRLFTCIALIALISSALLFSVCEAATGWSKTYPAKGYTEGYLPRGSVIQTSDGGYALAGSIGEPTDAWLAKTNSSGDIEWSKTYGGESNDTADHVIQTKDGGYMLAVDYELVKTDNAGNIQWNRTCNLLKVFSIIETSDGGYALSGWYLWYFCIEKRDASGYLQWEKKYGNAELGGSGSFSNRAYSLIQTSDGGYAIAGEGYPASENEVSQGVLWSDVLVVKADSSGEIQWKQAYGSKALDVAYRIIQTQDGGYAIAGVTGYPEGDAWLIKIDSTGRMQWNRTYGSAQKDLFTVIIQRDDGGYMLAGQTESKGAGGLDFWLASVDSTGNMQWEKTYGGTKDDRADSLIQTSDGGYAIAGYTSSYGEGEYSFWLVKTDSDGVVPEFPSILLVLLSMALVTLVAIICRKMGTTSEK